MHPPYCPNPHCIHHSWDGIHGNGRFWVRAGFYYTAVSGKVQRFICSHCKARFSERSVSLDYYTKKSLKYKEIFRAISAAESVASIARNLGCSPNSIQNRLERLGRNCIAAHARLCASLTLREHLCADGFESFDRSQFFPNNINLLVGADSQFLYEYTHTTIRRKGRMTDAQRAKRRQLEARFRPPSGSLRRSFTQLVSAIGPIWQQNQLPALSIRTDEHRIYPIAIKEVSTKLAAVGNGVILHEQYSSRLERTVANPLFPVNYYDRELRKDLAAFRRETTCMTKNVSAGLLRMANHLMWHNYCKPFRVKSWKTREKVHAQWAGMDGELIERNLETLTEVRSMMSHQQLSIEQARIWMKGHKTPLKDRPEYVPQFARRGADQGSDG